jgi:dihydropteroate synthase
MSIPARKNYTLKLKSGFLSLGQRTLLMGILNVTPDSFSDAGKYFSFDSAVGHAMDLIAAGADVLDIGGESTRPFSDPVPMDAELERVLPAIEAVRAVSDIPISIDTTKAGVARRALEAGADMINDVSALRFDEEMVKVAAEFGVPLILMHMQGNPKIMQQEPRYASVVSEVIAFLEDRIQYAVQNGVDRSQIVVDPGIGFGKTGGHNLTLIGNLSAFRCLDRPILLGASRKRFIGNILGRPEEDREVGTAAANAFAIASGVHILRVHDVEFHRQIALMGDAIRGAV